MTTFGAGRGVGILGIEPATGRGAPGVTIEGGALDRSSSPGGKGCRGPDRIWPGRGAGTGLAGMAEPRPATGGTTACPAASGGRNGCAERGAGNSSGVSLAGSLGISATGSAFSACSALRAGCAAVWSVETEAGWDGTAASLSTETVAAASPAPSPTPKRRRIWSATSSSRELECVFLSATPSSGSRSRMTLGLTSSSRASSLMRILLIRLSPARKTLAAGIQTTRFSSIRSLRL